MTLTLPDFLVTARSLAEYVEMFDLDLPALAGSRVLDCPGGAASFAAEAAAYGLETVAVDPAYAMSPGELSVRALDDAHDGATFVSANADAYDWTRYGSPAAHYAERTAAAGKFAWDIRRHPDRYVAASLPHLPFDDGSFDVVLSSHLLFMYADRLDRTFHEQALRELVRVVRPGGSVLVYPLVDFAGSRPALLNGVLRSAAAEGLLLEERPVEYRFLRGAETLLEVRRPS